MRIRLARALVSFAATALIYGATPLFAQSPTGLVPQSQAPQEKVQERSAQGQLMRVDTDAKTITIQSLQGAPMVFRYTDETRVVGGERGVAGLATMTGEDVGIQYIQQDKDNVASRIEIHERG